MISIFTIIEHFWNSCIETAVLSIAYASAMSIQALLWDCHCSSKWKTATVMNDMKMCILILRKIVAPIWT